MAINVTEYEFIALSIKFASCTREYVPSIPFPYRFQKTFEGETVWATTTQSGVQLLEIIVKKHIVLNEKVYSTEEEQVSQFEIKQFEKILPNQN